MVTTYIGVDKNSKMFLFRNKPVWDKNTWKFIDPKCVAPWKEIAEIQQPAVLLLLGLEEKAFNPFEAGDLYEIKNFEYTKIETHDWEG